MLNRSVSPKIFAEQAQLSSPIAMVIELRVPPPYDELYRFYLEAQIHYANGEMARYNNAAAQWNNAFLTYKDYRCRRERPRRGAAALRLF